MDVAHDQDLRSGNWVIGPRTRTYLQRPPGGKVITHAGRNLNSGEPVGVLLLRPPWHQSESVRRDYRHGAALLQRLDHAHVVKVHGLIDEDELFGVVTEPLPGDNLHRHIRYGGRIPTEAAVVRFMLQVASGLEHAHQRGVVFGNLKPSNVELFPDGTAKIFAVPKPPYQFTSFLEAADYLGYPVYNSPEMLRCEALDERTDVYGLGVCAYEMIVSRLPHQPGGNLGADLRALTTSEWPSPAEVVGPIHPLLNKIVTRCLQKNPAQRYPGVGELISDLRRVQASSTPLISPNRLLEIATSALPTPLAALAQALGRDDHLLAQKDKLLNLANGLVSYLGFLAATGRPVGREYARPSLGLWVSLLREACQESAPVGWPLDEFRSRRVITAELLNTLNEVVRLRNRMAHAPVPDEGAVLHDWVARMTLCIHALYKGLLFLANYPLVVVEDLDFQEDQFRVALRGLNGVAGEGPASSVMSRQPYTKGRVYLASADGSRLVSLHPWAVYAKCPLCLQRELFFYASAEEARAHYVTADRGHSWACELPPELKKMLAG
ncbi:MAG TPA: serine/threonine-protein kinase [Gemmataceae bacterium]|nr:serine/threonine-protein kinase [Gemmataceae bacterium]